jgi:hypothetical protein
VIGLGGMRSSWVSSCVLISFNFNYLYFYDGIFHNDIYGQDGFMLNELTGG